MAFVNGRQLCIACLFFFGLWSSLVFGRHLFLVLMKLKADIESVHVSIAKIESF